MAQIFDLLVFLLPVYVANSSPVVLGGGISLDLGMNFFDGKRLLGKGKTIRGFAGGILAGTAAGGIAASFYLLPFFTTPKIQFLAALALSFGTLCGDAAGSFLKRRLGMESGSPFVPDTVFFLLAALIFVFPFANSNLYEAPAILFLLVVTIIIHPLTNYAANKAGLKNVPW